MHALETSAPTVASVMLVPFMRDNAKATAIELGEIAREVTVLRRRIFVLHGAVVIGGASALARTLEGIGATDRARFLAYWAAIFVTSVVALALSANMRTRLRVLFARARRVGR